MTEASPVIPPYRPRALVRSSPSGKVLTSSDNAPGVAIAAPTPCRARNAIRTPPVGASPPSSEATPNNTRPALKTFFRPYTSPTRPATSSSPPNVSEYALITQFRFAGEIFSALWILGNATIMIVPSSTTMNRANAITHVATPNWRSRTGSATATGVSVAAPSNCDMSGVPPGTGSKMLEDARRSAGGAGCRGPEGELAVSGLPFALVLDTAEGRQPVEHGLHPLLGGVVQKPGHIRPDVPADLLEMDRGEVGPLLLGQGRVDQRQPLGLLVLQMRTQTATQLPDQTTQPLRAVLGIGQRLVDALEQRIDSRVLGLHRMQHHEIRRVGQPPLHQTPHSGVLSGVVDTQIGLEQLPPQRGPQDGPRIVIDVVGDPGDTVQLTTERVMDGQHHRHVQFVLGASHAQLLSPNPTLPNTPPTINTYN